MKRSDKVAAVEEMTATIIDIKPNGNLVFEARKQIRHDDEVSSMRLTGLCRSDDVTPDNSVLSTPTPGAAISTSRPKLLVTASSLSGVLAATAMMLSTS